MLSKEDTELLTRTGPGTPMGELWRRFWMPAMELGELPEPDCAPVRLKLLGEDLVAWRNTDGTIGVMQENCPHRGASMFFGRNEENGLRCVYHGWKFDAEGNCIDMPNEPAESNFKHKIHATAYRAQEWGGAIWVYMGPAHLSPELPKMDWCMVPPSHRYIRKWIQWCNYAQSYEGDLDTSHVSFLHRWFNNDEAPEGNRSRSGVGGSTLGLAQQFGAPALTVKETEYGFAYGARRAIGDGTYYWRVTQFLLPDFSMIPGPNNPRSGHVWIPRDDYSSWTWFYSCDPEKPIPQKLVDLYDGWQARTPRLIAGTHVPYGSLENDFLIDRELQKTTQYIGIVNGREQDSAVVDSMGPIMDRTKERLGTSDLAIIASRRLLLKLARDLQAGKEPFAATHGNAYQVRPLDVIDEEGDFGLLLEKYEKQVRVPVAGKP